MYRFGLHDPHCPTLIPFGVLGYVSTFRCLLDVHGNTSNVKNMSIFPCYIAGNPLDFIAYYCIIALPTIFTRLSA